MTGFDFRCVGEVTEKREGSFQNDKGETVRTKVIRIEGRGDSLELKGADAERLFGTCPDIGQECMAVGSLKRVGEVKFRAAYHVIVKLVGRSSRP